MGGKLGALWQMWKWRLRATNYACKRGLVVRFSPLKDLARTGESEEFLLLESGIREIFFLQSRILESGVQLKQKIHAKELNPHASSTDKESEIPNPRRGIQKTKIVLDFLTWTETSGGSGGGARGARSPYF